MKFCIIKQDNDPVNNMYFDISTEMDGLLAEMRKRGIESLPIWYSSTDKHSPDAYKTRQNLSFSFEILVRERVTAHICYTTKTAQRFGNG